MKKTNNHLITPNPIIIFSTYFLMNNDDMAFCNRKRYEKWSAQF